MVRSIGQPWKWGKHEVKLSPLCDPASLGLLKCALIPNVLDVTKNFSAFSNQHSPSVQQT
jgi:hypothetical protein